MCLPREEGRRREEEERRCERWRELSRSLINLRVSPSKGKKGRREEEDGKEEEEEDEVWKGVWRKGREKSVWGGGGGGGRGEEESSLWRSRKGEKKQVSFISW